MNNEFFTMEREALLYALTLATRRDIIARESSSVS